LLALAAAGKPIDDATGLIQTERQHTQDLPLLKEVHIDADKSSVRQPDRSVEDCSSLAAEAEGKFLALLRQKRGDELVTRLQGMAKRTMEKLCVESGGHIHLKSDEELHAAMAEELANYYKGLPRSNSTDVDRCIARSTKLADRAYTLMVNGGLEEAIATHERDLLANQLLSECGETATLERQLPTGNNASTAVNFSLGAYLRFKDSCIGPATEDTQLQLKNRIECKSACDKAKPGVDGCIGYTYPNFDDPSDVEGPFTCALAEDDPIGEPIALSQPCHGFDAYVKKDTLIKVVKLDA